MSLIEFPGKVAWSGENHLMSLSESVDRPFVTLASFFRVVVSPHGRGHALVLLQAPHDLGLSDRSANVCLTDNEPLARYLVDGFLAHFAAYRTLPAMASIAYHPIDRVSPTGDPSSAYGEIVEAPGLSIGLSWSDLGEPFAMAFKPDGSATGQHFMPTLIIGAGQASVSVNGRRLPGRPEPRSFAGRDITTAMLAFSETWVRAST